MSMTLQFICQEQSDAALNEAYLEYDNNTLYRKIAGSSGLVLFASRSKHRELACLLLLLRQ